MPFGIEGNAASENGVHRSPGRMSIAALHHCHVTICIPNDSTTTTWRNICCIVEKIAHFCLLRRVVYNSATVDNANVNTTNSNSKQNKNSSKKTMRFQLKKKPTIDCQLVTGARYASPYLMVKYSSSKNAIDLDIELY